MDFWTKIKRKRFLFSIVLFIFSFIMASCKSEREGSFDSKTDLKQVQAQASPQKPPDFEKIGDIITGAKHHHSPPYAPSKFIDKDVNTFWHSAGSSVGDYGWISLSYGKPFKASKYKLSRRANMSTQSPIDFILEGSMEYNFPDSDNKWEIIDEQKDQKWTDITHIYTIKHPKDFKHYKLTILKTADPNIASVSEWELIE